MPNTYLPNEHWNQRRDVLAATMLTRVAARLIEGDKLSDADVLIADAALEAAGFQMAEIGLMPEICREADAA